MFDWGQKRTQRVSVATIPDVGVLANLRVESTVQGDEVQKFVVRKTGHLPDSVLPGVG